MEDTQGEEDDENPMEDKQGDHASPTDPGKFNNLPI